MKLKFISMSKPNISSDMIIDKDSIFLAYYNICII